MSVLSFAAALTPALTLTPALFPNPNLRLERLELRCSPLEQDGLHPPVVTWIGVRVRS